jgi:methyl-accepting chemotaxis protein
MNSDSLLKLKALIFAESNSLRRQILQPVVLFSFFTALGLASIQYAYEQSRAKEQIREEVVTLVKFLQLASAQYLVNWDVTALDGFAEQAKSNPHIRQIVFYSLDDRPLTRLPSASLANQYIHLSEKVLNAKGEPVGSMNIVYTEDAVRSLVSQSLGFAISGYILLLCLVILSISWVSSRVTGPFSKVGQLLLELASISEANSQRLNESATDLSSTANQQSTAVQETVSSITEMRSMMEQTIVNIKNANELGNQISRKSVSGTETMSEMGRAMSDIRGTTGDLDHMVEIIHGMSEKTKVIHEIVFKTQLLAFNASIEAARAGQHGKGFAVVADEVRDLSNMAGATANDIETMIRESRKNVEKVVNIVSDRMEEGETISRQALRSFEEIAEDIKKLSSSVHEVFEATRDQSTGIAQTVGAMDQLNDAARNNSDAADGIVSLADEVRHSSHLLKDSSDRLMGLVKGHNFSRRNDVFVPAVAAPKNESAAPSTQLGDEKKILELTKRLSQRTYGGRDGSEMKEPKKKNVSNE